MQENVKEKGADKSNKEKKEVDFNVTVGYHDNWSHLYPVEAARAMKKTVRKQIQMAEGDN